MSHTTELLTAAAHMDRHAKNEESKVQKKKREAVTLYSILCVTLSDGVK